jgi:hypothetical protein
LTFSTVIVPSACAAVDAAVEAAAAEHVAARHDGRALDAAVPDDHVLDRAQRDAFRSRWRRSSPDREPVQVQRDVARGDRDAVDAAVDDDVAREESTSPAARSRLRAAVAAQRLHRHAQLQRA